MLYALGGSEYAHQICDWHENVYRAREYDQNYWIRIKEFIVERDQLRCQACRKKFPKNKLTAHHIIPRDNGGTDDPDNLIALCDGCHDFIEEQGWREIGRIKGSTRGIDWAEESRKQEAAHDEMMERIDRERPDWHESVYGCRRRRTNKPRKGK